MPCTRCQRQCIEVNSVDQSPHFSPSFFSYQDGLAWHFRALHCIFHLHFSVIRLSWHFRALHCKFPMYEDCRSRGRHVLLSCSNFAHEGNTYIHIDHGLVPKPSGFRQRTVLRAKEARPGVAT